MLDDSSKIS